VGGGSNAIGIFHAFLGDEGVKLIGVEAGGRGEAGRTRGALRGGAPGVLQGARSYVLQDENGQIALTHSVSAGLDYAMIGPEHAWLHDQRRAEYCRSDDEALAARACFRAPKASFRRSNRRTRWPKPCAARPPRRGKIFLVNLSGRGDKDIDIYRENFPELDQP
jgi:tryptophan synthase beta chain